MILDHEDHKAIAAMVVEMLAPMLGAPKVPKQTLPHEQFRPGSPERRAALADYLRAENARRTGRRQSNA